MPIQMGTLQNWLEFGSVFFYCITAAFIVVYFIIWLINYLSYKKVVKSMNEDIEKLRNNNKQQL